MNAAIFAVDVGGVLADKQHEGEPVSGCQEVLRGIAEAGVDIWVVSQCGLAREHHTIDWLAANGFAIPKSRQIYIRMKERNKNRVLNGLRPRWFIDDRPKHVLPALDGTAVKCVFHLAPIGMSGMRRHLGRYRHVQHWREVWETIVSDLKQG